MILNGRLEDWSVEDLLQIMRITNKTGSLILSSEPSGMIHFFEGKICAIDLDTAADLSDSDRGVAINVMADHMRVLLPLRTGRFRIGELVRPTDYGVDVPELLELVDRLLDLERAALGDDVAENTSLKLRLRLDPITLEPDAWLAVADLVGTFSLERLVARFGRSEAIQLLHLLRRSDLFESTDELTPQASEAATAKDAGPDLEPRPFVGPTPSPEPLVGSVLQDIARLRPR